jgi:hypothetical protein
MKHSNVIILLCFFKKENLHKKSNKNLCNKLMIKYFKTLLQQQKLSKTEIEVLISVYTILFFWITYLIICKLAYYIGYFSAKFNLF